MRKTLVVLALCAAGCSSSPAAPAPVSQGTLYLTLDSKCATSLVSTVAIIIDGAFAWNLTPGQTQSKVLSLGGHNYIGKSSRFEWSGSPVITASNPDVKNTLFCI